MSKQEEDNMQREFKKIVDGIIAFNDKVGGHLPNIAMSINSSLFNYMNAKEMERQQAAADLEAELASLDVSDSVPLEDEKMAEWTKEYQGRTGDTNNCENCEGQEHEDGCEGCPDIPKSSGCHCETESHNLNDSDSVPTV